MCGIYFHEGRIFADEELNEKGIADIVKRNLEKTALRKEDEVRLKGQERLKELHLQLGVAKSRANALLIAEIQAEIDTYSIESERHDLDVVAEILSRGPDYASFINVNGKIKASCLSSVLLLRQPFTKQPVQKAGFVVQFNGELYNECDNDVIFLVDAITKNLTKLSREDSILAAIARLDGEFAFVITDCIEGRVYFGKDPIGKRSLLYLQNPLVISLVATGDVSEVPSHSVHIAHEEGVFLVSYSSIWRKLGGHRLSLSQGKEDGSHLRDILQKACLKRIETIQPLHDSDIPLAVLFSGGLDCSILAALSRSVPLDLLTVGFENPRTGKSPNMSPDRRLSERSWYELCKRYPRSSFRLVKVDVPYEQWLRHKRRVMALIHPKDTEMDLSIAIAFYFASGATNATLCEPGDLSSFNLFMETARVTPNYQSPAKVLFSGLGADELFGGYTRHELLIRDSSDYGALFQSLKHDIDVLYERNLGRDDRVILSWGKEARYPFLDSDVVNYAFSIRSDLKVRNAGKIERKWILRQVARSLGLDSVSDEPKRAIQFGARSAKMELGQGKVRGTNGVMH